MALNKKQTSLVVKVVIVFVIISFIATLGGVFSQVVSTGGNKTANGGQTTGTDQLAQIGAEVKPGIDTNEQALKTKPKDYELLKQLGDQYFDWAVRVQQASPQSGLDGPLWTKSADYYKRALAIKNTDPAVGTDGAIATYYSGDVNRAITLVEAVMKRDPKFPQAPFNAGVFYRTAGQNAKAIAAWQAYLKLEPTGEQANRAKQFISETQAAPANTATGGATPVTQGTPATTTP
jgi:tetratricopeptide (TPR) repeat protein